MFRVSSGEGNGNPLQHSCLENAMDGGAWWAAVHGVTKSQTRLSDCTFTFDFHALEKEMATHSSVLAWRILGMAEPGVLPSIESHRVGHNWSDLAAAAAAVLATVLTEFRTKNRIKPLWALAKQTNRPLDNYMYFRKLFMNSDSCIFPYSEKQ